MGAGLGLSLLPSHVVVLGKAITPLPSVVLALDLEQRFFPAIHVIWYLASRRGPATCDHQFHQQNDYYNVSLRPIIFMFVCT